MSVTLRYGSIFVGVLLWVLCVTVAVGSTGVCYTVCVRCVWVWSCRIVVGVPRGTPEGAVVDVPGYVADCPLLPGDCAPLSGNGMGDDVLLYDVTGGWVPGGRGGVCVCSR